MGSIGCLLEGWQRQPDESLRCPVVTVKMSLDERNHRQNGKHFSRKRKTWGRIQESATHIRYQKRLLQRVPVIGQKWQHFCPNLTWQIVVARHHNWTPRCSPWRYAKRTTKIAKALRACELISRNLSGAARLDLLLKRRPDEVIQVEAYIQKFRSVCRTRRLAITIKIPSSSKTSPQERKQRLTRTAKIQGHQRWIFI